MKKFIGLLIAFMLAFSSTSSAQAFDSARIYPICFKQMYRVAIDRMYIKSLVDTTVYADSKEADSLYSLFQNRIKSRFIKEMPSSKSYIDISMGIEFFKNGRVTTNIGVTSQEMLNINNTLYTYSLKDLKQLDQLFPGMSKLLCLD